MIYDITVVGTNSATKHLDGYEESRVSFRNEGGVAIIVLNGEEYAFSNCHVTFLDEGLAVAGLLANKGLVGRIVFYLKNPRKEPLD
jgi:hypothetical protein